MKVENEEDEELEALRLFPPWPIVEDEVRRGKATKRVCFFSGSRLCRVGIRDFTFLRVLRGPITEVIFLLLHGVVNYFPIGNPGGRSIGVECRCSSFYARRRPIFQRALSAAITRYYSDYFSYGVSNRNAS